MLGAPESISDTINLSLASYTKRVAQLPSNLCRHTRADNVGIWMDT